MSTAMILATRRALPRLQTAAVLAVQLRAASSTHLLRQGSCAGSSLMEAGNPTRIRTAHPAGTLGRQHLQHRPLRARATSIATMPGSAMLRQQSARAVHLSTATSVMDLLYSTTSQVRRREVLGRRGRGSLGKSPGEEGEEEERVDLGTTIKKPAERKRKGDQRTFRRAPLCDAIEPEQFHFLPPPPRLPLSCFGSDVSCGGGGTRGLGSEEGRET